MNPASDLISIYDASVLIGQSKPTISRLVRRGMLAAAPNPHGGKKLWVHRAQVLALREMIKEEGARRQKALAKISGLKQMYLDLITRNDKS